MSTELEVLDGELVDPDRGLPGPAGRPRGLNVSGFNRDTVLVAGQELPSPFVQPVYSARDFVISEETAR
ncbi:integrase, partial [Kitasatospora aureofaciens]|nr:integrase [Kitasatospora aureofaciens]